MMYSKEFSYEDLQEMVGQRYIKNASSRYDSHVTVATVFASVGSWYVVWYVGSKYKVDLVDDFNKRFTVRLR